MKPQAPPIKPVKGSFRAKQALGQHFIHDEVLLDQLVALCGIGPEDAVFEIGPGMGGLTAAIARKARQVISLEVDPQLLPILAVTLHGLQNVRVLQGDVMQTDLTGLLTPLGPFHVIANLPYYLTTPILNLLFGLPLPLLSINVMVQREAALRIVAAPSTPAYGPLAVLAQYRAAPAIARDIPRSAFSPPPKAESVFVRMPLLPRPSEAVKDERVFFRLVQAAFAMRRKTLVNNLMPAFHLTREEAEGILKGLGLDPRVRGEALGLPQLARLSDELAAPQE
ncbi:MAG: 16S rRNA (adenine(1518)-N(6)/adenine(1519)-N(6))-dimethyltransferase RsmA [Christensenellales bacterium]